MHSNFDAIVIGAGQAGPSLAARLDAQGMRVAMIERKHFGGTCVNTGCRPTKTMVASAYAAHMARRGADYGFSVAGPVSMDMQRVHARAQEIIMNSRDGVMRWMQGLQHGQVFQGHARFESKDTVRVGEDRLSAPQIFLDVGGRARIPAMPGLDRVPYFTNTGMMDIDFLPEHLVVVGGSYIGLEFAQMFRRFGSKVTIVERSEHLLPREDPEVGDEMQAILAAEGIEFQMGSDCIAVDGGPGRIVVNATCTGPLARHEGSHLLLAVGRQPNTDDLGLEQAGVTLDKHGFIPVDDCCRSEVPGIWAMGECNGRGAFTHTAYNDFEIVAAAVFDESPRRLSDRIPCYGLFTDPPLSRIGLTQSEAIKQGHRILVGTRRMTHVGRAVERAETLGFIKIVVDADSQRLLGASILGVSGDEAIHCLLDCMYAKAPYTNISRAVYIHPTVCELLPTVLQNLRPPSATEKAK